VVDRSGGEELVDALAQPGNTECSGVRGHRTVLVDERKRWLAEDPVGSPYRSIVVDGVVEPIDGQSVDKALDGVDVIATCDADDQDIVAVVLMYLCDRRGFGSTGRSPGRPEPEHDVLALEAVPVDLAAACDWDQLRAVRLRFLDRPCVGRVGFGGRLGRCLRLGIGCRRRPDPGPIRPAAGNDHDQSQRGDNPPSRAELTPHLDRDPGHHADQRIRYDDVS
jgi:hypothetical protein